ncbi:MAG: UDP-3-O-(3-hydroxymyristoyl)glucosamine N-acyltransferase [Trueperaceae bacterium]
MTWAGDRRGSYDARALAGKLSGQLEGSNPSVTRLAQPGPDCGDAVIVVSSDKQLAAAESWKPALVVAPRGLERPSAIASLITVVEPRLALAQLTSLFDTRPLPDPGVHPSATVAQGAVLAEGARVGAGAVIGAGAAIGSGTIVGEGALVGAGAVLGSDCRLHARASLLDGVKLGDRVIVHSGAVLGSDGFGYVPSQGGALKLHHLGTVVIGDDVEIGANTCVDRGTLGDTLIGDRTKIDNLCQIAHNVTIGSDCLIAGQCGIAGSTRIGDRVTMAGSAGVADHLTIGDGATLGPRATVLKDVPEGETWIGYPAQPYRRFARQSYLSGKLERIWRFVKQSEEKVGA